MDKTFPMGLGTAEAKQEVTANGGWDRFQPEEVAEAVLVLSAGPQSLRIQSES